MNNLSLTIKKEIEDGFWPGYVHTYPHKRAYRPLTGKYADLRNIWNEKITYLNLYVHIPFCDKKCSYCNLFSTVYQESEKKSLYELYVEKVIEEIDLYSSLINKDAKIMSLYFGGGTPSVLSAIQLGKIIGKFKEVFPNWDDGVEVCMECAPETLTKEYLTSLKKIGIKRISVGIQSFNENELNLINRSNSIDNFKQIHEYAHQIGLATNIDLIYGLPKQSKESALHNVSEVIRMQPETVTIYPLAIRKLTGLENVNHSDVMSMTEKYALFDDLRTLLENNEYSCQTVVRFVRTNTSTYQQQRYEYQGIPTLGVGCGARSYAPNVHYCMSYKVKDSLVKAVIDEYMKSNINEVKFDGFVFDEDELKRKYVSLTLLDPGINTVDYTEKFGTSVLEDFENEFDALFENSLISQNDDNIILTKKGRKYCDIAVSIFESNRVTELYKSYIAK